MNTALLHTSIDFLRRGGVAYDYGLELPIRKIASDPLEELPRDTKRPGLSEKPSVGNFVERPGNIDCEHPYTPSAVKSPRPFKL